MACGSLSRGFDLQCMNSNPGGISHVVVAEFVKGAITSRPAAGVLAALPSGITDAFKYELKNTANVLTEQSASDVNNRTNTYTQTLTVVLNFTDAAAMEEFYQLTNGEVFVFVFQNNGEVKLMGAQYGVNTSYAYTSGGEIANGSNVTLTFSAVESFGLLDLDSTAITALNALI